MGRHGSPWVPTNRQFQTVKKKCVMHITVTNICVMHINDADEWIKKDLEYISKRSFILDLNIILKTIITMFKGTGK